jgi:hypothetical protein
MMVDATDTNSQNKHLQGSMSSALDFQSSKEPLELSEPRGDASPLCAESLAFAASAIVRPKLRTRSLKFFAAPALPLGVCGVSGYPNPLSSNTGMLRGANVRLRSDPRCHDEEMDSSKRIEKIVARRRVFDPDGSPSFEYLVKYKGVSYLHVEWLSPNAILRKDDRYKSTLKKFVKLWLLQGEIDAGSGEYFDPSYTEV